MWLFSPLNLLLLVHLAFFVLFAQISSRRPLYILVYDLRMEKQPATSSKSMNPGFRGGGGGQIAVFFHLKALWLDAWLSRHE